MDILNEARGLLNAAGYQTSPHLSDVDAFNFEDDTTFGIVLSANSAQDILLKWQTKQDSFLRGASAGMGRMLGKAWNAYVVLLTPEIVSSATATLLVKIEEDLQGARKLARASIRTRDDLESALGALLPIRHSVLLQREDATMRLVGDVLVDRELLMLITEEKSSVEEIARRLLGEAE